jgi:hypothetical protein
MDKNSLVEREGVNAGSAEQLDDESGAGANADVRGGGDPDAVRPEAPVNDLDSSAEGADSDLLGAPDDRDRFPGQAHGSAGQDAGSIQ